MNNTKFLTKTSFIKLVLIIPILIQALNGCVTSGFEWSELSFTRGKPVYADVVGIWMPTAKTLKDMKERGGYAILNHEIIFKEDGTFSMVNMPDWWKDVFGK